MEHVYLDEVLRFQDLIKKRHAVKQINDMNIARSAWLSNEEAEDLVREIRSSAGLPDVDYLDAPMDKSGLEALKSQLSGNADKKV